MKKSKQTKASKCVDGPNTLGNLPDDVLQSILSRITSTEEVVRTSILSRRWRYLWTSLPSIDVDYFREQKPGLQYKRNQVKEYKFKEFVYWVLSNKSLDLDSFRLCCSYYDDRSAVGRWIHSAVTRNVKQLHLVFRPEGEAIEMPHCLVTCGSLEVLRLNMLQIGHLRLPNYTGFPSLRVFELNKVQLYDSNLLEAIIESCPMLEDLSLVECIHDRLEFLCISCLNLKNLRIDNRGMIDCKEYLVCGELEISCPNLVFLELAGTIAYYFLIDSLDSLKKAVIHPVPENGDLESICEVFSKISHVESLSINISFLAECIDPAVQVAVSLPNLKTLELTINCMDTDAVQFIKCFPDLESLYLNIDWDCRLLEYWKLNDPAMMRILTRQLKRVDYLDFDLQCRQLEVARFFLEHGNALEEMVFCWKCDDAKFHERSMKTMNEVSNFKKASSTVKLIALNKRPKCCYYNFSSKV